MSFDLNIQTTCNHRIFRELSALDTDKRSLRVSKPIASAASVKVYGSDNYLSPSLYSVVYDPRTITVNQPRMIYFKEKWRSPSDRLEISYVTLRGFCPKCVGLEHLDDIDYDIRGEIKEIRNENLLLQNLEKFTVTIILSNPFHSFIGTSLISLMGNKIIDVDYITTKISQEINTTINKFKDLQQTYKSSGRVMSDGEILEAIENIEVYQDKGDPTIFRAVVTVMAKSGKPVQYTQILKAGS